MRCTVDGDVLHCLYVFVHPDNQGCMVAWRRHAVRCRLGIAERQAEEHHRKRYPEEINAAFEDFKPRFDNFVDQLSQDQRSARKRKRIHAYLTQVFGDHHGMWDYLQTGEMPPLYLMVTYSPCMNLRSHRC